MAHTYTKTTFINGQSPTINANELNKIGDGIIEALNTADDAAASVQRAIDEVADLKESIETGDTHTAINAAQNAANAAQSTADTAVTNASAAQTTANKHASRHGTGGADAITPASIGAAAASHNHTAGQITSGQLPVGFGGTGASTAAQARQNLGAAAADHTHTFAGITSGILTLRDSASYGTGNPPTTASVGQLYFKIIG